MANELSGRRVAIIATDGVEQVELEKPREAVEQAGATTELLSIKEDAIQAMNSDIEPADTFTPDKLVGDADPDDYDGLILPGGTVNADKLRVDESAQRLAAQVLESGKPLAVICHGPWLLVSAALVEGRRLTSFPSLSTDVRNAGGDWVDEEVVVDDNLITSRNPDDLKAFVGAIEDALAG